MPLKTSRGGEPTRQTELRQVVFWHGWGGGYLPSQLERIFKEESGQGLVEYAFILLLVAMAVVASLGFLGDSLAEFFGDLEFEFE